MKKRLLCLPLFIMFLSLSAQEALKSIEEEYYDFLSLQGITERPALGYRTLSDNEWAQAPDSAEKADGNIWKNNTLGTKFTLWQPETPSGNAFARGLKQGIFLRAYGPEWFNSVNTALPYGQNDGALWQGRGYNSSLTAGIRLEGYGLELTLKPQASFSQNLGFELMPAVNGSDYSYFVTGMDLVQRYGDSEFWGFDWGDSEIRWTWHKLTVGFGTQSAWLGPAWLNPMLGSNNAASYPKLDFGLRKTELFIPRWNFSLGQLEARLWSGRLEESAYFDVDDTNNYRMINGLSVSYAPSFIPGLTLTANRVFLTSYRPENLSYLLRLFGVDGLIGKGKNDVDGEGEDQKVSLGLDYHFTKIGFESYFEYGFDDFTSNKISNPFHTGIYTMGIKQLIPLPALLADKGMRASLNFELNNFEMSQDFQLQWRYPGYYSHSKVKQGYTSKGQIIGAGSGSMGNSQYIGLNLYFPKGSLVLFYHRYCPDNNYIYNMAVYTDASYGTSINKDYYAAYETYNSAGGKITCFITDALVLGFEFDYAAVIYPNYKRGSYIPNLHFALTGKYNF